jgi:hypothetical protein
MNFVVTLQLREGLKGCVASFLATHLPWRRHGEFSEKKFSHCPDVQCQEILCALCGKPTELDTLTASEHQPTILRLPSLVLIYRIFDAK